MALPAAADLLPDGSRQPRSQLRWDTSLQMVKLKQNASTLHSLELNSSRFGNLLLKGKSRSHFIRWCLRWKTGSGFIENTDNFLPTCVILLQRMGTGGGILADEQPLMEKGSEGEGRMSKGCRLHPSSTGRRHRELILLLLGWEPWLNTGRKVGVQR